MPGFQFYAFEIASASWPLRHLFGSAAHNFLSARARTGCTTRVIAIQERAHRKIHRVATNPDHDNSAEVL